MASSNVAATADDGNNEPPDLSSEQEQQQVMLTLNSSIFATLDAAQSMHGIPLQDYAQYHAYCSKRLHRISHHKDVRSILTHNAKYESNSSSSTSGGKLRRHAYCPRNLSPENVSHEYVLWNLLFQAERAWAQACAAQKEDASTSSGLNKKKKSNNNTSRKHNHVRQRLNKAVKWASQFLDLTKKACCHERPAVQQEAQAYWHWMQANAHLECKHYADAYRHYQNSRRILLQLANDSSSDGDDSDVKELAIRDLWTRWAESVLKPLVRYCLHEARDTLDPAEVLALEQVSSSSQTSSGLPGSSPQKKSNKKDIDNAIRIEFRNQTIALDAYPQLAVLYLKMEEHLFLSSNSDEKKQKNHLDEAAFLQLLTDLDDATSLTSAEAAKYARLASSSSTVAAGPAVQAKRKELATLTSFFTHHKLQLQRQRQEDVISSLEDVAGIVHVYDALLQNAQAMVDLHSFKSAGDDNDQQDDHPDEDDPYWLEAQAHLVRIRAWRCFHLARLYESLPNSKAASGTTTAASQVAALLQQASLLQQRATEEVAACEMDDSYLDALQELQKDIQSMTCRVEATRFLELQAMMSSNNSGGSGSGKTTDRPLWLRLDDLDAGTGVLADQPPLLIPVPYKPVFYDLAYDYVFSEHDNKGLQTIQNYLHEHGGGGETKEEGNSGGGGGGIFGWFSGK